MQIISKSIDGFHKTTETQKPILDTQRRFSGLTRLYGPQGYAKLSTTHMVIIGIGGVGSWAAECLARCGINEITLIDMDHIAESNINRQIHALSHTLGIAKVQAMRERIEHINPNCQVYCIEDFISSANIEKLLPKTTSVVIDCIDQLQPKVALAAWCRLHKLMHITCGAAGGKTDVSRLKVCDLSETIQDPLLAKMRSRLRKEHGFAAAGERMQVTAVFSSEPLRNPESCDPISGLNCAGFGSAMHLTASMGLMAAGWAINSVVAASS